LTADDPDATFSEEVLALDEIVKCWAINSKSCSLRSAKLIPIADTVDAEVEEAEWCAACQGHHQPEQTGLTTLSGTKRSEFTEISFEGDDWAGDGRRSGSVKTSPLVMGRARFDSAWGKLLNTAAQLVARKYELRIDNQLRIPGFASFGSRWSFEASGAEFYQIYKSGTVSVSVSHFVRFTGITARGTLSDEGVIV
jgi:hypothetical protein